MSLGWIPSGAIITAGTPIATVLKNALYSDQMPYIKDGHFYNMDTRYTVTRESTPSTDFSYGIAMYNFGNKGTCVFATPIDLTNWNKLVIRTYRTNHCSSWEWTNGIYFKSVSSYNTGADVISFTNKSTWDTYILDISNLSGYAYLHIGYWNSGVYISDLYLTL